MWSLREGAEPEPVAAACCLRFNFSTFNSDRKFQSGSAGRNEGSKRTDTTILLKLAQAGKVDIHEMLLAGDEALVTRSLRVVKVVAALAVGLDMNFRISSTV